ncbi:head maturation protease, ClpP-related [Loktanella sp. 3ANDIMAR09]|uniref:head maturation protease, ClpP-related n=1 Tax=Loktanella sp. 3ANDIMAR09 TaxID=1225657 RepID=UPI0006FC292C|nr:head maturation protease, ClpP-related [Loktanella sp. 3ANDIMAR09]
MAVILKDGNLTLTGYVGDHWEYAGDVIIDGITQAMVLEALGQIDDDAPLTVRINSGGGIATDGVAIRSALAERSGRTDVVIEGIAASAASIIAMAGETITMATGSQLMIHDPSGFTFGTADDHDKSRRALDSIATGYARVYAKRSGQSEAACRDMMKAETWMDDAAAVAAGFADATTDEQATAVAAFPYQSYARAPQPLVAMAQANGWRHPAAMQKATANSAPPKSQPTEKEFIVTNKTGASAETEAEKIEAAKKEAVEADRARRTAVLALDEAKGREALAEHMLTETESSVDEIKAILAAAPKASTDDKTPLPPIGDRATADGAGSGQAPQRKAKATIDTAGIYASRRQQMTKG